MGTSTPKPNGAKNGFLRVIWAFDTSDKCKVYFGIEIKVPKRRYFDLLTATIWLNNLQESGILFPLLIYVL